MFGAVEWARIWAAEELIRTARRANLKTVSDAMANEPFWGVRVAVAQARGGADLAAPRVPLEHHDILHGVPDLAEHPDVLTYGGDGADQGAAGGRGDG